MRNNSFLLSAYAVILFTLPCARAYADMVTLKSGKKVEGKIIENASDYIKLEIIEGTAVTYFKDDIAQIDKASVQDPSVQQPGQGVPQSPRPGLPSAQPGQVAGQGQGQLPPARPGQGAPAQGSPAQPPPLMKPWNVTLGETMDTFSGEGESYSMVPPAGWSKNENIPSPPPNKVLVSYKKIQDNPMPAIVVLKESFPPTRSLTSEEYLDLLRRRFSTQSQSVQISAPEKVNINGIPMHKITVTSQQQRSEIYCIVTDTYALSLSYRNSEAAFAEDYNIFKQCINSLNRKKSG